MPINYNQLSKKPQIFIRIIGVSIEQFNDIVKATFPVYIKYKANKNLNPNNSGRIGSFKTFEDKLLCLFIYYRCYVTHEFLGMIFDAHNSNICRLFK